MKILHIPNYYYPHVGGIEQTARDIVNAIGISEQRVLCFNGDKKDAVTQVDGYTVIKCGSFIKISSQSLSFSYGKAMKKQFNNFNPDIVVFHYPNPFAAHYLLKNLKKFSGCKLVLWWHLDITKQKILGKLFKGQTERLLKRADKIVATSPNYLDGSPFLLHYKDKCVIIPSCINENRLSIDSGVIAKSEEIRKINDGKIVCFAIGRHVEYKGFEYLIKASAKLGDNFKIYLAGEGELTSKLKKLAEGDSKIEFLGYIDDDTMKAYMNACDIYCFPSITKNEAFGLALAEAMHFGKPAVTFTIEGSGVNYVNLKDVTGLEVENGNAEAYAEAIETLAQDDVLRRNFGDAAKVRTLELFSSVNFNKNVNNLLKSFK